MKVSLRTLLVTMSMTLTSTMSLAGVCEIAVTRVACAGKEADSYKKCDGKPSCTVKKKSDSAEDCAKAAADECANSRLDITKSKEITAKFGGAAVKSKDGKEQFCAADRPDFNKCK